MGDEPDEDDDEMNNTDGEGEEGEEEQDDILIVEGEDEGIEDDDVDEAEESGESPNLRGKSAKNFREIYNCSSAENPNEHSKKGAIMGGLTPANNNKSLNASQEEVSTQLYGGDIYLLGGSHFLMKDQADGATGAGQDENNPGSNAAKFSQASTTTGSEMPYKSGGTLNR